MPREIGKLISRSNILTILASIACVLLLLWPALLNEQYLLFFDSVRYIRAGAQALYVLFDFDTAWTKLFRESEALSIFKSISEVNTSTVLITDRAGLANANGVVMGGVSVYYGLFLYVSDLLGSLWLSIALQASTAALAIHMTLLQIFGPGRYRSPLAVGVLAITTPLSFFVSYVMPDFLASIAILAVTVLLVFHNYLTWRIRAVWLLLLVAALASHTSHIATSVALVVVGILLVRAFQGKWQLRAAGLASAAIMIGILSEVILFTAVKVVYGQGTLRPPFLMARMISDGPGYAYLLDTCPGNGYRICDFLPRLPQSTDEILWSKDLKKSVYGNSNSKQRREMVEQQLSFVFSVLKYDLFGQIYSSIAGFGKQLSLTSIMEFRYTLPLRKSLEENIPKQYQESIRDSLLYRDVFPIVQINLWFQLILYFSYGHIFWRAINFIRQWHSSGEDSGSMVTTERSVWLFVSVVLAGVILNGAVTGILSTPHDRYQARVIWLIPMLSLVLFFWSREIIKHKPSSIKK